MLSQLNKSFSQLQEFTTKDAELEATKSALSIKTAEHKSVDEELFRVKFLAQEAASLAEERLDFEKRNIDEIKNRARTMVSDKDKDVKRVTAENSIMKRRIKEMEAAEHRQELELQRVKQQLQASSSSSGESGVI